jgi:hypothetical protein
MSRTRPRIEVIPPRSATGELKEAYVALEQYTPRVGHVVRIFSLRPYLIKLTTRFFTELLGAGRLSRVDKELICVATSKAGNCAY